MVPDGMTGQPRLHCLVIPRGLCGLLLIDVLLLDRRGRPPYLTLSVCLGSLSALLHCRRPTATQESTQAVNINGKGKFSLPHTTPTARTPPIIAATATSLTPRLGRVHTDQRRTPRRSGHHRNGSVWATLGARRGRRFVILREHHARILRAGFKDIQRDG